MTRCATCGHLSNPNLFTCLQILLFLLTFQPNRVHNDVGERVFEFGGEYFCRFDPVENWTGGNDNDHRKNWFMFYPRYSISLTPCPIEYVLFAISKIHNHCVFRELEHERLIRGHLGKDLRTRAELKANIVFYRFTVPVFLSLLFLHENVILDTSCTFGWSSLTGPLHCFQQQCKGNYMRTNPVHLQELYSLAQKSESAPISLTRYELAFAH